MRFTLTENDMWFPKKDLCPPHLRQRVDEIRKLPISIPPSPWIRLSLPLVGGLLEVGFSRMSDFLLVISHDGRGVFDCSTGEKVARDRSPLDNAAAWHDHTRLQAQGIGPIFSEMVSLSGLWGGGLPKQTQDGWRVEMLTLDWPCQTLILQSPEQESVLDARSALAATIVGRESEVRAYGFSYSGKNFVLATSDSLLLWKKESV